MVPINNATNNGPLVGMVPIVSTSLRFRARLPAIASAGMITRNRAISISKARVTLNHGVLAFRPPKELPLVATALALAYKSSLSPCGPGCPNSRWAPQAR